MVSKTVEVNALEARRKKYIILAIKLVIGVAMLVGIALIPPPEGLTVQAMWFLAILCTGIYLIAANVAEEYIIGIFMLVAVVALKILPFSTAFSGFSSGTVMLVMGGFGIGAALVKCGLLARIAALVASKFPRTYIGRVTALYLAGIIVNPAMPSQSAKAVVLSPLAVGMGKELGYKPKSRPATGLFLAIWVPSGILGAMFFSSMTYGPLLGGMVDAEFANQFTWVQWFINALPWTIVTVVIHFLAIIFLYKPRKGDIVEGFDASNIVIEKKPMSKNEKISLVVLILTLALWITGQWTGLGNEIVAMAAFVCLALLKVMDRSDVSSKISWSAIIFLGAILGLANMFTALEINVWLQDVLSGLLTPLVSQVLVFVIALAIAVYLLRSVILSQAVTLTLFFLVVGPIAAAAGIHPFVTGFIITTSIGVYAIFPQNAQFVNGYYAADGGEWVNFPETIKISIIFMIANIAGLLVSIPFWGLLGLL